MARERRSGRSPTAGGRGQTKGRESTTERSPDELQAELDRAHAEIDRLCGELHRSDAEQIRWRRRLDGARRLLRSHGRDAALRYVGVTRAGRQGQRYEDPARVKALYRQLVEPPAKATSVVVCTSFDRLLEVAEEMTLRTAETGAPAALELPSGATETIRLPATGAGCPRLEALEHVRRIFEFPSLRAAWQYLWNAQVPEEDLPLPPRP